MHWFKAPTVFRNRNFSRLFFGQATSRLGDSFYTLAILWMAQSLTSQLYMATFWIGAIVACGYIGRVVIAPIAGSLVTRWNKRTVLIVTDFIRAALLAVFSVIFVLHHLQIWQLMVFQFVISSVGTFFTPANVSMMRGIVDDETLLQANSVFSTTQTVCSTIGPALCGLLIGAAGFAPAFLFDCLTFLVSVASLLTIDYAEPPHLEPMVKLSARTVMRDARGGLHVVLQVPILRSTIAIMLLYNFAVTALEVLLVLFVHNALRLEGGIGATMLGLFNSAIALGDFAGGVLAPGVSKRVSTETMIPVSMLIGSTMIFIIGFIHNGSVICVLLFTMSIAMMLASVAFTTKLQLMIPREHLSRVWAWLSAFDGLIPASQLTFTALATWIPIRRLFHLIGLLGGSIGTVAMVQYVNKRRWKSLSSAKDTPPQQPTA